MSIQLITADLLTAARVIGNVSSASTPQKCRAVEEIKALGIPVDQLTVRQLMDIAMRSTPPRVGTASMVATSSEPQRRAIVQALEEAGINTATVHEGMSEILQHARLILPKGLSLDLVLRGISHASAARLLRSARLAASKELA